jgi:hypothetical protein
MASKIVSGPDRRTSGQKPVGLPRLQTLQTPWRPCQSWRSRRRMFAKPVPQMMFSFQSTCQDVGGASWGQWDQRGLPVQIGDRRAAEVMLVLPAGQPRKNSGHANRSST